MMLKLIALFTAMCLSPLPLVAHHHGTSKSGHHCEGSDCKGRHHAKNCDCKDCKAARSKKS